MTQDIEAIRAKFLAERQKKIDAELRGDALVEEVAKETEDPKADEPEVPEATVTTKASKKGK